MTDSEEKTVLIIEDQEKTRVLIKTSLEAAGYKTLDSVQAGHGIQLATQKKVDLILLDVNLPDMDGFTACRKLKEDERTFHIPVIMCTARGMQDDVKAAVTAGANGYIVKPFQKKTVVEKVAKTIGLPPAQ